MLKVHPVNRFVPSACHFIIVSYLMLYGPMPAAQHDPLIKRWKLSWMPLTERIKIRNPT